MSRYEELEKLKKLEAKAGSGLWQIVDGSPTDGTMNDLRFMADLRNAAPWLFAVASCFQEGDAALLGRLAYEEADMERFRAGFGKPDTRMSDMLKRLQEAARMMEEKA